MSRDYRKTSSRLRANAWNSIRGCRRHPVVQSGPHHVGLRGRGRFPQSVILAGPTADDLAGVIAEFVAALAIDVKTSRTFACFRARCRVSAQEQGRCGSCAKRCV